MEILALALIVIPLVYVLGTFRWGIKLPEIQKRFWTCSHTVICGLVALAGWVIFPEMQTLWAITFTLGLLISAALLVILAKPLLAKP